MNVMKTSLMIFPCVLRSAFPIIRVCSGLSFATKGLGHLAALYLLLLLVARYNYLIIKLSVTTYFSTCREYLAGNRLSFPSAPRWVRRLTYQKDYDRSPILVGHQDSFLAPFPGSEAPLVRGIW